MSEPNDRIHDCTVVAEPDDRENGDGDVEGEDDPAYPLDTIEIETFLKIKDTLTSIKTSLEEGRSQLERDDDGQMDAIMENILAATGGGSGAGFPPHDSSTTATSDNAVLSGSKEPLAAAEQRVDFITHSSVIYNTNRLDISKQTTVVGMRASDHVVFTRIVRTFVALVMGTYTRDDLVSLRADHDSLVRIWDGIKDDVIRDLGKSNAGMRGDINDLMKTMLETPVYYITSCVSLIACGRLLRNLYTNTTGRQPTDVYDLLHFLRRECRHVDVDPFACDCPADRPCSSENKLLLSMILELPALVHSQSYLLQILAYLMYDANGREEIFVINMKNVSSPGLLDRIPMRTAMLLGTLDEVEIKRSMAELRRKVGRYTTVFKDASRAGGVYSASALTRIVGVVTDPRASAFIDHLPGAVLADFTVEFPPCGGDDTAGCTRKTATPAQAAKRLDAVGDRDYSCCGRVEVTARDLFTSSISLAQLMVYMCTNTAKAPLKSRQNYYVRDIIVCMSNNTINVNTDTMEEAFGYLDKTDIFTGFENNPMMTMTLQKLVASYVEGMESMADRYRNMKTADKRRAARKIYATGTGGGGGSSGNSGDGVR